MWRAAGWAGTDKRTSSPSVLVTADKSKPLKFNGGHATERGVVRGYVCVCGSCGFTGAGSCHTQAFNQWDIIVMLIKSTACLMCDGSGSRWTSGKEIRPISLSFVAKECFGWIRSCWPTRILWFHLSVFHSASYCLNREQASHSPSSVAAYNISFFNLFLFMFFFIFHFFPYFVSFSLVAELLLDWNNTMFTSISVVYTMLVYREPKQLFIFMLHHSFSPFASVYQTCKPAHKD